MSLGPPGADRALQRPAGDGAHLRRQPRERPLDDLARRSRRRRARGHEQHGRRTRGTDVSVSPRSRARARASTRCACRSPRSRASAARTSSKRALPPATAASATCAGAEPVDPLARRQRVRGLPARRWRAAPRPGPREARRRPRGAPAQSSWASAAPALGDARVVGLEEGVVARQDEAAHAGLLVDQRVDQHERRAGGDVDAVDHAVAARRQAMGGEQARCRRRPALATASTPALSASHVRRAEPARRRSGSAAATREQERGDVVERRAAVALQRRRR